MISSLRSTRPITACPTQTNAKNMTWNEATRVRPCLSQIRWPVGIRGFKISNRIQALALHRISKSRTVLCEVMRTTIGKQVDLAIHQTSKVAISTDRLTSTLQFKKLILYLQKYGPSPRRSMADTRILRRQDDEQDVRGVRQEDQGRGRYPKGQEEASDNQF